MASDKQHFLRNVLLAIVAVVVVLAGAATWLFGSESGAQLALSAISNGRLHIEGVRGRLAGPLQIERLTIESDNRRIDLDRLRFDWLPSALPRGVLHVTQLHADKLTLASKIDQQPEPAKLPDSIDLPLALRLDSVAIGSGAIAWGPLDIVRLGPAAFSLDFDHARYRFRLQRFSARSDASGRTLGGTLEGEATLAAAKPYALLVDLTSKADAVLGERKFDTRGRIRAGGSLAEIMADIDLSLGGANIQGNGVLRPFAEQALGNTSIAIRALDLAAFDAGLPRTGIDADMNVAADGRGRIELSNTGAGLYDERRLPLHSLRAGFAQRKDGLTIEGIAAALGSAGQQAGTITGSGRYVGGGLTLGLTLDDVDLRKLHGRIRATRLDGRIDLRHADRQQHVVLDLTEPFGKQHLALSASGTLGDTVLAIERAELRLGKGRLHAAGKVELAGTQAFRLEGDLSHLRAQDLGRFAQLPSFDLSGKFALRGTRSPALEADLDFRIDESKLAGRPLRGDGKARLRGDRLSLPGLVLAAGDNKLEARGELAEGNAQIGFALSAPKLEQLGAGIGGALNANGTIRGTPARPHVVMHWNGERLTLPRQMQISATEGKADVVVDRDKPLFVDRADVDASARELRDATQKLASLVLRMQFAPQAGAPLMLDLRAAGIAAPRLEAPHFQASVQGTTADHRLHAELVEAGNQRWSVDAKGGLRNLERDPRWQGSIERLDAAGRFLARLAAPAALSISKERFALEQFHLEANTATVSVDRFVRDPGGIVTRGRVDWLQVAELLKFAERQTVISTDLVLDGDWNVTIGRNINGNVNLRRSSGDLVMKSGTLVALGLNRLEAHAAMKNGLLNLQFNADGRQLGHIALTAATRIAEGGKQLAIDRNAPLSGGARIDIPSLAWAGPMINATAVTEGRLQSDIVIKGSLEQPRVTGRIAGSGLRLYLGDTGIDLRQGVLDSEFHDDRLVLHRLAFDGNGGVGGDSGNSGRLAVSGPIAFAGGKPDAQLTIEAQRFRLLNRSDRKLVLSGNGKLSWAGGKAWANGAFAIDSAYFDIGREDMPQLSDDVVIVGREKKQSAPTAASVDIDVDLGNRVALQGKGLDATLTGRIRLAGEPGTPLRAQGTISVAKGTYSTYGRKLAIEQGVLRFSGPLNNPALDILAMRRGEDLEVEAGVAVRGTVLAPRVTLVSEPSVPEAEKLSWLVLGRGLESADTNDLGALQDAAGALLAQGAVSTVQSRIATAFGLDDFKIATSQDNLQQRVVTIGKRISSRLYVGYEQGLRTVATGATSVLMLRYTLSDHLTVEAEAGTRSALSLLYNIMFD